MTLEQSGSEAVAAMSRALTSGDLRHIGGKLPRAFCPTCSREVAVRTGGQLREHRDHGGDLCPASGMTPEQVTA